MNACTIDVAVISGSSIRRLVRAEEGDDPEAVLCYRLDALQARELAAAIGAKIDPRQFNFYLEGFAEGAPARDADRSSDALADASRLLADVISLRKRQQRRDREASKHRIGG